MKNKGFSMMELLVVVGIFVLMMAATLGLLISTKYSTDLNEAQIQVKETAKMAIEKIAAEIRLSRPGKIRITNAIGWPTGNDTTIQGPNDTPISEGGLGGASISQGNSINFQIPTKIYDAALDLSASYNLKWGCANPQGGENIEGHYLNFSEHDHNLIRHDYDTNGRIQLKTIATNISSLMFSRDDTNSSVIKIDLTSTVNARHGTQSQTLTSYIKVMN